VTARINVPCNGNAGNNVIDKVADTITFGTSGNCKFISFQFTPTDPAPGFSNLGAALPARCQGAYAALDDAGGRGWPAIGRLLEGPSGERAR